MLKWSSASSVRRRAAGFVIPFGGFVLLAVSACGSPTESGETTAADIAELTTPSSCSAHTVEVIDLHADFRDIWAGRETADTGKQADPNASVSVDFGTTVDPARATAQFVPVATDGSCGASIAASLTGSVIAADVWGKMTSNSARPTAPAPYNLFAREFIDGLPSSGGALAAGGVVSLSSFNVNGTVRQSFGLVAGDRVNLVNGSVTGNLSYGTASTIPGSVSVSGTKSQQPFAVDAAFASLSRLSHLLAERAATGSAQSTNGTLVLSSTKSGVSVFAISADALAQAGTVRITVPSGAGALVNVSGGVVSIQSKNVVLTGTTAATLLWNLPSARIVQIASIGLPGSVLAPDARLSFESGSITGNVVARSLTSPGSGALLSAPLNATLHFGSTAPSATLFKPQTPLVRGCEYDFVMPSTQRLTSGGNCLSRPLSVRFRVARGASTPATRELENATGDFATKTLRRFVASRGINTQLNDVWTRYEAAIGAPPASLAAVGAVRRSPLKVDQALSSYQQYHLGYPVFGHGYSVASEDGIFREAVGRVTADLPTTLPAPISSGAALQAGLQFLHVTTPPWVSNPSVHRPPESTLGLLPKRPEPKAADFVLVWDIDFARTGIREPASLQVDAATGRVIRSTPGAQAIAFLDPATAVYVDPPVKSQVDYVYGGLQNIDVAQYRLADGTPVTTLASKDLASPGVLATYFGVDPLFVETHPVFEPIAGRSWGATDSLARGLASAQWGLERSHAFLQTLGFRLFPGEPPWASVDRDGHQKVILRWANVPGQSSNGEFNGPETAVLLGDVAFVDLFNGNDGPPVALPLVPHEFGHVLLFNARAAAAMPTLRNLGETGSTNEGLADLFAIASVHRQFGKVTNWQCSSAVNTCRTEVRDRNIATPGLTDNPSARAGADFGAYVSTAACPDADNCFVHQNSTIISHWGYVLAFGGALPNGCDLDVEPLSPDPDVAFQLVLNISYVAAATMIGRARTDEPTFADFRDATLSVARAFVRAGEAPFDTVRKMEIAWDEVNVGPQFHSKLVDDEAPPPEPIVDEVSPREEERSVNPWQAFTWPAKGGGQTAESWDFQLADGPFDPQHIRWEATGITETLVENGTTRFVLKLALPFETDTRYFWRVRPSEGASAPWASCYPVHTFVGTVGPDDVTDLAVPEARDESGAVRPGTAKATWGGAGGAVQYRVGAARSPRSCGAWENEVDAKETGDAERGTVEFGPVTDLEPSTHYVVEVRPVGPNGFDGEPSLGGCFTTEIDTGAIQVPDSLVPPLLGNGHVPRPNDYRDPVTYSWSVYGGTVTSLVRFFERDERGECAITPAISVVVDTPCPGDFRASDGRLFPGPCSGRLERFAPTQIANPTGYCWDVTARGKNLQPSLRANARFEFWLEHSKLLSPGIDGDLTKLRRSPDAPLPGKFSFGAPVTLSWTPDPLAVATKVRVWKFAHLPETEEGPPACTHEFDPLCGRNPTDVTFEQATDGSSITIDGRFAARGRYCWTTWPLLEDPTQRNEIWRRQPLVALWPDLCYRSGPATPRIAFDHPLTPGVYSSAPITGTVTFDYIPEAQGDLRGTPPEDFDISFDDCLRDNNPVPYLDFYDCVARFTINPKPNTDYKIEARTWNSEQRPPVLDDSTLGPTANETFRTAGCGAKGEGCCPDDVCNTGLACSAGKCVDCGAKGEPCCTGNTCDLLGPGQGPALTLNCENRICDTCGKTGNACCPKTRGGPPLDCTFNADCKNGRCTACGDLNQACCHDRFNPPRCPAHDDTLSCFGDKCSACGHAGQACCPGALRGHSDGCLSGTRCMSDSVCHTCGHPGEQCCEAPDSACRDGSACVGGQCPGSTGGGGGVSCAPGFAACGADAQCLDLFALGADSPGWLEWRETFPTAQSIVCVGSRWLCGQGLDYVPAPPGLLGTFIDDGLATCCPPTLDQIFVMPNGEGVCCPLEASGISGDGECL